MAQHGFGIGSVLVEGAREAERIDHRAHEIAIMPTGGPLGDQTGEDVVGVRIVVSRRHGKLVAWCGVSGLEQILGREIARRLFRHPAQYRLRLGVVRDAARHVEQAPDGDVLPDRILRQPLPDRVLERELAGGLKLRDHGCAEGFRCAPHLEERVSSHGRVVRLASRLSGKSLNRRTRIAEADVGRDPGDLLDRRAVFEPRLQHRLDPFRLARLRLRARGGDEGEPDCERGERPAATDHFRSLTPRLDYKEHSQRRNAGASDGWRTRSWRVGSAASVALFDDPAHVSDGGSRGIAQPGSAEVLGTSGRRFESCCPDHFFELLTPWPTRPSENPIGPFRLSRRVPARVVRALQPIWRDPEFPLKVEGLLPSFPVPACTGLFRRLLRP